MAKGGQIVNLNSNNQNALMHVVDMRGGGGNLGMNPPGGHCHPCLNDKTGKAFNHAIIASIRFFARLC